MKKILIAGESDKTTNYENAFRNLGALPVTSLHVPFIEEYDALVLPGGGDIDPLLFGQINKGSRTINPELDRIQFFILKSFVKEKKPILGICKGMQLINIAFGGDIHQNLNTASYHEYIEKDQIHPSCSHKDSLLSQLYGCQFNVNSAHHQGCWHPGHHIRYIQYANDGVIEGLCHCHLPIIGVQWHPERMCFDHASDEFVDGSILLSYFLSL